MTIRSSADTSAHISTLTDRELLDTITREATNERSALTALLELLGEVDARRLYLPEGFASLFTFCREVLAFSEHEAYHRIEAARAARRFPALLDRLREGAVTLTSITLLSPHLTTGNAESLIESAMHQSRREVERQMAAFAPKPDAKSVLRRLPVSSATPCVLPPAADSPSNPALVQQTAEAKLQQGESPSTLSAVHPGTGRGSSETPSPRPLSVPLSPGRYLLRVTLSEEAHALLRRAQDLLHHTNPTRDPAATIERALEVLVEDLERRRMARVKRPRTAETVGEREGRPHESRYIPAAVRRTVWARDEGRCAFAGRQGRCAETGGLELHHLEPFARGGAATAENLELRCRAHNQYEGALLFGSHRGSGKTDMGTRPGPS